MVELLTLVWLFNTSQPARSMLTAQAPHGQLVAPDDTAAAKTFTVKFTVDLKKFDGERIIQIGRAHV